MTDRSIPKQGLGQHGSGRGLFRLLLLILGAETKAGAT
jgi:hypothetical protein